MRHLSVALTVVAAAGSLVLAGCGSDSDDAGSSPSATTTGKPTGSITVFAAASLTEAFGTIKKQVEAEYPGTTVNLQLGASSDLATQITQGKPADVFASASTKNMTSVTDAKDADKPRNFVSNTLEIATPPKNPATITTLADLAKPGVKVAVCDAAVPCGAVAKTVLANAKLTVKPAASLQDVKSTLAVVESGEADAGLVYVTDVRAAGSKVHGVEIADDVNASTTYPIATLTHAKNKPLAKAFVQYVLSAPGQQVLRSDGFSAP
ncbi:molybdate transport system substrate-binding protein [Jatrophihabitans endophyticus]|uniref:Molybdate transport system substrate-binding protein n=1 Tax=Jatrophihabitans endophyticus TaxID=1206085 RepID=A0A1M5EDB5_9ACTN|nr:molybdate ABC transporter substrate-binding protein [Jatrophihabitans endophyticus]SHF77195.1 molybdate transport system substrate-binding protein [Jatrophihabitans endophyticus]